MTTYPFLERLSIADLRRTVEESLPARAQVEADQLSKVALGRVLFALHGFDLLYERQIRVALLASLTSNQLRKLSDDFQITDRSKPYDIAVALGMKPWRYGSKVVDLFAKELEVPPRYLPQQTPKAPRMERLGPIETPPPLFPFQQELATILLQTIQSEAAPAAMLQLPTGAGKTRTTVEGLIQAINQFDGPPRTIVWMAHTVELCEQALETIRALWPFRSQDECIVSRLWGNYDPKLEANRHQIVIASYQKVASLRTSASQTYEAFVNAAWIGVLDEAHMALAPTIQRIVTDLKKAGAFVIGLTATPGRGSDEQTENRELAETFGRTLLRSSSLGSNPIQKLQSEGYLAKVTHLTYESGYRIFGGEDNNKYRDGLEDRVRTRILKQLARSEERNSLILSILREQVEEGHKVLVFACSVAHSRALAARCAGEGISSAALDSSMRDTLRRRVIASFRSGALTVLSNYGVLSTGFDDPKIDAVLITRPTSSVVLYSQMIGRGLRGPRVGGTATCRVIDVKDNLQNFGEVDHVYQHFEEFWEARSVQKPAP